MAFSEILVQKFRKLPEHARVVHIVAVEDEIPAFFHIQPVIGKNTSRLLVFSVDVSSEIGVVAFLRRERSLMGSFVRLA